VFNAVNLEDPREVLSIGFVGVESDDLATTIERVSDQEKVPCLTAGGSRPAH
jgi:hypothetical protein